MRAWLPLLMLPLLACGASESVDGTTDGGDPDPRFDASTWPDTLGSEERPAAVYAPSNYDGVSELPVILSLIHI